MPKTKSVRTKRNRNQFTFQISGIPIEHIVWFELRCLLIGNLSGEFLDQCFGLLNLQIMVALVVARSGYMAYGLSIRLHGFMSLRFTTGVWEDQ